MFRLGDIAIVRSTKQEVVIISAASGTSWLCQEGTFCESDLQMKVDMSYKEYTYESGPTPTLRNEVNMKLLEVPVDHNGHHRNGKEAPETATKMVWYNLTECTHDELAALHHLLSQPEKDTWLEIRSFGLVVCQYCSDKLSLLETNGSVVRQQKKCPNPKGLGKFTFDLNIPSGELVLSPDLRRIFPLPANDSHEDNTLYGRRKITEEYLRLGLAHGDVDGCFTMYQDGPTPSVFTLSSPWGKSPPRQVIKYYLEHHFSICDGEVFTQRLTRTALDKEALEVNVVPVLPGVYRFTHNESPNGKNTKVFTTIRWLRDPDPVQDFVSQQDPDVNPHAYVQALVRRRPLSYGKVVRERAVLWQDMTEEQRTEAWWQVADDVFRSSLVPWDPRGFPRVATPPGIEDVAPPRFVGQRFWNPGQRFDKMPKLSASFARFAFRVLESVISFGTTPQDFHHKRDVDTARKQMRQAMQQYRSLIIEHPGVADPDYAEWISQPGRAESWIEQFDLGPEQEERHLDYVSAQAIFPANMYAVAFCPERLPAHVHGFCWHHSIMKSSARKQDAHHFWIPGEQHNGCAVPRFVVARVVTQGDLFSDKRIIEVAFDYGSKSMMANTKKALYEWEWRAIIKPLTKEQYEALLPLAEVFHKETERDARLYGQDRVARIPPVPREAGFNTCLKAVGKKMSSPLAHPNKFHTVQCRNRCHTLIHDFWF
jgi:hypothetical protein